MFSACFIPQISKATSSESSVKRAACLQNLKAMRIICDCATFLTTAHAETIISTQLFAGKFTNQI